MRASKLTPVSGFLPPLVAPGDGDSYFTRKSLSTEHLCHRVFPAIPIHPGAERLKYPIAVALGMGVYGDLREAAEEVNDALGSYHSEYVFREAFCHELTLRDYAYTCEATIPVIYKGHSIAQLRPDVVVGSDELYVVEIKVGRDGTDQLEAYLKHADRSDFDVEGGVMISFGGELEVVER